MTLPNDLFTLIYLLRHESGERFLLNFTISNTTKVTSHKFHLVSKLYHFVKEKRNQFCPDISLYVRHVSRLRAVESLRNVCNRASGPVSLTDVGSPKGRGEGGSGSVSLLLKVIRYVKIEL